MELILDLSIDIKYKRALETSLTGLLEECDQGKL